MIIPIVALGLPEDSINYLEQGIRISEALNDQPSLVRFYGNSGIYYANRGKNDEGVTYTQKAYETAVGIGDVAAMAQVGPDFAMVCMSAGRYPETIETATQVTHAVERAGRQSDYFGGMTNIYSILKTFTGFSMGMLGEFPEGIAISEAAIDSAVNHGGPETIGYCECQLGVVLLLKGRCEQAYRYLNDGVSHLEEAKFYWHLPLFRSMLGLAEVLLGQDREGLSHIESALGENRQNNIQWRQSIQYLNLGICRYLQNEYPLARQAFQKAHAASIESGERHVSGKVLVWSGLLESKLGLQAGEAEKEIFKGIEILRELGTRPDLATAYHFLGQVLKRGGKEQAACNYLNQAKKSFHQLGIQNPFNV